MLAGPPIASEMGLTLMFGGRWAGVLVVCKGDHVVVLVPKRVRGNLGGVSSFHQSC